MNSLTGRADNVEVQVVVVVPHQRDLDIGRLGTFALKAGLELGHGVVPLPVIRASLALGQLLFLRGVVLRLRQAQIAALLLARLQGVPPLGRARLLVVPPLLLADEGLLLVRPAGVQLRVLVDDEPLLQRMLVVPSLVEALFCKCSVTLILLSKHVLNGGELAVQIFFAFPNPIPECCCINPLRSYRFGC